MTLAHTQARRDPTKTAEEHHLHRFEKVLNEIPRIEEMGVKLEAWEKSLPKENPNGDEEEEDLIQM